MQVLFDGDVVVYRAGFAAEKVHYYVEDESGKTHDFSQKREAMSFIERNEDLQPRLVASERIVEPVENALYNAKSIITSSLKALGANEKDLVVVLSGPTNFRNGVATTKPYKGNRDPTHRPVHGPDILEYLHKRFHTVVSEDEEADDVLGYTQYAAWQADPFSTSICTIDKDLSMIPGLHYNFVNDNSAFIDEKYANLYFYRQLLTGDTVDNIPGVPGIGPKKALEVLPDDVPPDEIFSRIRTLYVQGYAEQAEERLLEMGRLLWIRRIPGEWWSPPPLESHLPVTTISVQDKTVA